MTHGHLIHFEIPADDLPRAKAFYAEVFGWQIDQPPGFDDYQAFRTGQDGVGGAIGLRDKTGPHRPRMYITVESLDAALAKVKAHGGSTVVDRTEVPGMGWYAAVNDSEGNEIGLWEDLPG